MNLQEKLINLSDYKIGFNVYCGHTIISVTYPDGWSVIKPENENIAFAQDEVNTNTYFYSAPITLNMDEIFECIETSIEFNKEMEKKINLFQEKQKELQQLFVDESYETLEKLTFNIKKKNKKNKQTSKVIETKNLIKETSIQQSEELTPDEIKGIKKNKTTKKQTISNHTNSLELLPGEEICEDIIISNNELNNGIY